MNGNGSIKCCHKCYAYQPNGVRVCFVCGFEFFPSKRDKLTKLLEEAYEAGANAALNSDFTYVSRLKYINEVLSEHS